MSDDIKIHYDERFWSLRLVCDPEAFGPFREFLRDRLADHSEINLDEVLQFQVVDITTIDEKREASKCRKRSAIVTGIVLTVMALAAVGVASIIGWFVT